uniref:Protein kinase domain-containing protein n=1 Tax=Physcomitrium patens TaxID=3218 RepID=A0A2K1J366_PHYPA|nr:hypothetical protein PHYPA_021819 [Physcomitrium patens]
MNNKESFREYLCDLKYCYNVASDVLRKQSWKTFEETILITFNGSTFTKAEGNNKDLYKRLVSISGDKDVELAKHLLQRLKDMPCIESGELDIVKLFSNIKNIKYIEYIGKGSFKKVYKIKWLELLCALKKIHLQFKKIFTIEMSILIGLSHPNLINYYFVIEDNNSGNDQSYPTKK